MCTDVALESDWSSVSGSICNSWGERSGGWPAMQGKTVVAPAAKSASINRLSPSISWARSTLPRLIVTRGSRKPGRRSEEHTSELQSLMRISYAVFCLKKKKKNSKNTQTIYPKHRSMYNIRAQHIYDK